MSKTIRDIFALTPVAAWRSKHAVPLVSPMPGLLYGVELELEDADADWTVEGMQHKADGSLRNNGVEYVTNPMTYSTLAYVLDRFAKRSLVSEDNISERCSVHVHVNCQNMTIEQVQAVCMLYQVFERLLFNFAGPERANNIFCVPWEHTKITYGTLVQMVDDPTVVRRWEKYTAMNLLPLMTLGTLEFRHMEGTPDMNRVLTWCRILGCLFAAAERMSLADVESRLTQLNTTSAYKALLDEVFQEEVRHLAIDGYEMALEEGVLNLKYSLLSKVMAKPAIIKPTVRPTQQFVVQQTLVDTTNHTQPATTIDWVTEIERHTRLQVQRQADEMERQWLTNEWELINAGLPGGQREDEVQPFPNPDPLLRRLHEADQRAAEARRQANAHAAVVRRTRNPR